MTYPKVDPYTALKFLKEGVTRETLIEAIATNENAIIDALKNIKLDHNERNMLISSVRTKRLFLDLIEQDKLSLDERIILLSKNLDSSFAWAYAKAVKKITDDEEKYLVKCFVNNPGVAINFFRYGGYAKFSKSGLNQIKEAIWKDSCFVQQYLKYKPDAPDRKEAFEYLLKTAKASYEFFKHGKPTTDERTKILEKLAMSRTYLRRLVEGLALDVTNHDKKLMAQVIAKEGDLHQARIMYDNVYDKNVRYVIEHLALANKLMKVGE